MVKLLLNKVDVLPLAAFKKYYSTQLYIFEGLLLNLLRYSLKKLYTGKQLMIYQIKQG